MKTHSDNLSTFKVMDLFCGTGGISYGLTMADSRFQMVCGVDADVSATMTARLNHSEALIVNSTIEVLDPKQLIEEAGHESIDVIVGGPPCQGFTSLRPSRGDALQDPRNQLYGEFQRFVYELRPKVFLLENVVGLVNANQGQLLSNLLEGFRALGYAVDWRILNAANYGVPQKRERFFLLGLREDVAHAQPIIFPKPTRNFSGRTIGIRDKSRQISNVNFGPPAVTAWQAISDLPSIGSGEDLDSCRRTPVSVSKKRQSLTMH